MSSVVLLFLLWIGGLSLILFFYSPDDRVGRFIVMLLSSGALVLSILVRRTQRVYSTGSH